MIAVISFFASIIGSIVLYKINNSARFRFLFMNNHSDNISVTGIYLFNKINGFIIFGLLPGILVFAFSHIRPAEVGLSFGFNNLYWYLPGILFIVVITNFFLASNPDTFSRYPEMRFKEWTKARIAITAIGWIIYLFGYEFLFRGLLFFSIYHSFGLLTSLAVNAIIYSLVHIPKGKAEMIGAIPFGILLCCMALLTGSIILPFLIHLSLALSTDFFSIHYNPKMKLAKS